MSKRILVVEDQPDNRQIIRDMLAPTDYEITTAMIGIDRNAGSALIRLTLNIHQDEIGSLFCDSRQRLLAVFRLGDFVVGRGKHIANDLPIIRLVLHHQNALVHVASTCRSTMIGSVKLNVDPWPTIESTQIRPPCISMMRLDMASPKPVPPFLRVIALSAC